MMRMPCVITALPGDCDPVSGRVIDLIAGYQTVIGSDARDPARQRTVARVAVESDAGGLRLSGIGYGGEGIITGVGRGVIGYGHLLRSTDNVDSVGLGLSDVDVIYHDVDAGMNVDAGLR